MSYQEFDLSPDKPTRRRFWIFLAVGLTVMLCLCVSGVTVVGVLTGQNMVAGGEDVTVSEAFLAVFAGEESNHTGLNRISFIDEQGQIGTVAPDGTDRRQLTNDDDRIFLFPAWSPDGSLLAAVGSARDGGGVFVVADRPAGADNEPQSLYFSEDQNPFYLYWSPTSRQISFLANDPRGIGLHLVDADGNAESRLLDTGRPFYWHWNSTGDRLLYHTGLSGEDARLAFLDISSGNSGENLTQPGFFQAPGISAAEEFLAFAEIDDADARWLVVRDSTGTERRRVPHFGVTAFSWSPVAPQVAFISPDAPDSSSSGFFGSLRLLDVETGDVTILSGELVLAFFWSPDGQQIAYVSLLEAGEDVTAEKETFRARPVAQQEEALRLQLWVTDVNSGESQRLLVFQPTVLYVSQFLPFFDQYALSHRIWSPDSRSIVLPVQEAETDVIYVVSTEDGSTRAVAEGIIGFWSPR